MNEVQTMAGATAPGLIERALSKLLVRHAEVLAVDTLGPFVHLRIGGPTLDDAGWQPGDKVQVQLGGWTWRTYTPFRWASGEAELLVYRHGDARGANWAGSVARGEPCSFFGPRRSLDLGRIQRSAVIVGDETSLGLALALAAVPRVAVDSYEVAYLFEVSSEREVRPLLDRFGLSHVTLVERRPDHAHTPALERELEALLATRPDATIVLSGHAGSIQSLTRGLRQRGVARARVMSKAYWAPGKKGLD